MKKIIFQITVLFVFIIIGVIPPINVNAAAYSNCPRTTGWNLISLSNRNYGTPADGVLNYTYNGAYIEQFNVAKETYNNLGQGIILAESPENAEIIDYDVVVTDKYDSTSSAAGTTFSTGKIVINAYHMENYRIKGRINVVLHELGHAYGMGHNPTRRSIVYPSATALIELSIEDREVLMCLDEYYW